MKRLLIFFCLVTFLGINCYAQDYNETLQSFMQHYQKDNLTGMKQVAQQLKQYYPDDYAGYAFAAYTNLLENKLSDAEVNLKSVRILNPVDLGSYSIGSYKAFLNGNTSEAEKLMHFAFQLKTNQTALQDILGDISQLERFLKKDLSELKKIAQDADNNTSGSIKAMKIYTDCTAAWWQKKDCNVTEAVNYFNNREHKNVEVLAQIQFNRASAYYDTQQWEQAQKAYQQFLELPVVKNGQLGFAVAHSLLRLSYFDADGELIIAKANQGLKYIEDLPNTTFIKCELLMRKMHAYAELNDLENKLVAAQTLLNHAKKVNFTYAALKAKNTIGAYYIESRKPGAAGLAYQNLFEAYQQVQQFNEPDLQSEIASNYALALWKRGEKSKAKQMIENEYEYALKNSKYLDAQNLANNLAFMFYMNKDYTEAAALFEKAIAITENHLQKLPQQEQLLVMNNHAGAYSGLVMSYRNLNETEKLFKAQDLNRSRILKNNLNKDLPQVSLAKVQSQLAPDEVMLYYSTGEPGEMIVSVITSTAVNIGYNFPIDDWLQLKKKFINVVNQQPNSINNYVAKLNEEIIDGKLVTYSDKKQGFTAKDYNQFIDISREFLQSHDEKLADLRTEFLKHWYQFLIQPMANQIQGKKTLIISAEGKLGFIPFEAFINPSNRYLIEDFNVKYIPSATIWASLQNRNYSADRKSLLAMGGATYGKPNDSGSENRSMPDVYQIKNQLAQKISENKVNLKEELSQLGFGGANYLAGTLKEVQNLKSIVPDATILINEQMKESDIKRLDKANELANYKWLHIATHGFALDNFPQLSGVMMMQPPGGDGQEDMFLLAHEIAQLNLQADMAVLSACETALGKVYKGEGVNGLNSALLTAGANNTLLSLWPVNDAGTMVLMTLVYNNLNQSKMSVEDAVNSAKREMLSGKYGAQFATPVIWAPFVINGK
ncbi:CHAT domain-containing protein [Mesonia sp.]|uniref:CHAT domain-containing protein n=1 Tax=Mesonia sp. TaxID=1960830 RepID=UPI00175DA13D|nr:CHAT domain-containing protein [Mesonia sp.]HIB37333.1 CHAT domain-containing protein [Mesonia sp.]HIO25845.1 CHAT domain-containing protein [Flavobacteriaceae bacterium]